MSGDVECKIDFFQLNGVFKKSEYFLFPPLETSKDDSPETVTRNVIIEHEYNERFDGLIAFCAYPFCKNQHPVMMRIDMADKEWRK